jgi:methylglutaconyl-CoA hydratase
VTAAFSTIEVEHHGDWACVFLARPEVRNAFNETMIAELHRAFGDLGGRHELRALVLAGRGDVFCAGADVDWMRRAQGRDEAGNVADARAMADLYRTLDQCPVPVIARVQKAAFGGALGLLAACDIVVAESFTRLAFTEVRLGIVPAVISSFTVAKIGLSQARRYFLTGETFTAEQAPAGLVHEVVPKDQLDSKVGQLVAELREAAPGAVREIKNLLRQTAGLSRADALELCVQTIARVRVGEEARAGLAAFLQKSRAPWRPGREGDR